MHMQMGIQENRISALDLPEIRDYLGDFLDDKELLQCIRVCKQWHQSFEPFLYRTVPLVDPANDPDVYYRRPPFDKLIHYRSHVRSLTILDGFLPVYPLSVHYNNLEFVRLDPFVKQPMLEEDEVDPDPAYQRQVQTRAAEFIQQHRNTLQSIDIYHFDDLPNMQFWIPLDGAPRMRALCLFSGTIRDHSHARAFWQACLGLTSLSLDNTVIPNPWGRSYYTRRQQMPSFPRLLELGIEQFGMDIEDQIQLLRQCPQLRKLSWAINYDFEQGRSIDADMPSLIALMVYRLSIMAAESCLQHLKYLSLRLAEIHPSLSKSLTRLLDHLPPLVHLVLSSCGLNEVPFHSLERHFSTLKILDLTMVTSSESSKAVQMVMVSCPLLECLCANVLHVSDVMTDIQRGQSWMCLRLNTLHLQIEIDYPVCLISKEACQLLALEQLARLPCMRVLYLNGQEAGNRSFGPSTLSNPNYGMDLRLSKGLDLLGCWTELEAIGFPSIVQKWGNDEVDWVLERWPCLDAICGTIQEDTDICLELQERLFRSGINLQ
ncbi:hypothetical protein BG011_003732 [Mortierella polycephala]|uniref:F-box domain-containing protein n=1 Tax=Mortierella polycephala TaxID=41804 RepID=A0A9P6Q233_9FUNG|nr:hypothetical protein BG011_003732 [Mortierella polycephala]